jgi:hypothetical protein
MWRVRATSLEVPWKERLRSLWWSDVVSIGMHMSVQFLVLRLCQVLSRLQIPVSMDSTTSRLYRRNRLYEVVDSPVETQRHVRLTSH